MLQHFQFNPAELVSGDYIEAHLMSNNVMPPSNLPSGSCTVIYRYWIHSVTVYICITLSGFGLLVGKPLSIQSPFSAEELCCKEYSVHMRTSVALSNLGSSVLSLGLGRCHPQLCLILQKCFISIKKCQKCSAAAPLSPYTAPDRDLFNFLSLTARYQGNYQEWTFFCYNFRNMWQKIKKKPEFNKLEKNQIMVQVVSLEGF